MFCVYTLQIRFLHSTSAIEFRLNDLNSLEYEGQFRRREPGARLRRDFVRKSSQISARVILLMPEIVHHILKLVG